MAPKRPLPRLPEDLGASGAPAAETQPFSLLRGKRRVGVASAVSLRPSSTCAQGHSHGSEPGAEGSALAAGSSAESSAPAAETRPFPLFCGKRPAGASSAGSSRPVSTCADGQSHVLVSGDDAELTPLEVEAWQALVRAAAVSGKSFCDVDFPAAHVSVSGTPEIAADPKAGPAPAPVPAPVPAPIPVDAAAAPAAASGDPAPSLPDGGSPPSALAHIPLCGCGDPATLATVVRATANQGKQYHRCPHRVCGFFAWVEDGEAVERPPPMEKRPPLRWARMAPEVPVVTDFGFRAQDLRQGGVGDCWFTSALAVVAERHDLIRRLFSAQTEREPTGCHCVRLFLDGCWRSIFIDDLLPISPSPRRPTLATDARLAFCRCAGPSGSLQLWASLVEKAYAKAHGSYRAISGGQISEALLDLTGAPTELLDLSHSTFEPELFWARLTAFHELKLPMGCCTNTAVGEAQLREMGLVGNHAYSLLDVREVIARDGRTVRLLRIRNPHGVGEWNGDWSDSSRQWADLLTDPTAAAGGIGAADLERTGVDDGTFWQEYIHFLQSFSHVDVCFALRGWHARSLPTAFPADKKGPHRLCGAVHLLRIARGGKHGLEVGGGAAGGGEHSGGGGSSGGGCGIATLFAAALQPTRRGSWCRADRKKSYKLGDLSLLIAKVDPTSLRLTRLVGAGLRGADRGERVVAATLDDLDGLYAILPVCFGAGPSAAETVAASPFTVRVVCSEALHVTTVQVNGRAPPAAGKSARGGGGAAGVVAPVGGAGGSLIGACGGNDTSDGISGLIAGREGARRLCSLAVSSLHALALADPVLGPQEGPGTTPPSNVAPASHRSGVASRLPWRGGAAAMATELLRPEMAALLPDGGDAGGRPSRRLAPLGEGCTALTLKGAGMMLVFGYNAGASPATFRTLAYAKSSAARAPTGPVPNEKTEAEKYISARLVAAQARLGPGPAAEAAAVGAGAGFKWPARWQCFEASCDVGSGQRRLLMVVAASGVQAELAEVKCSLVGRGEGQSAGQALGGEAGQSPAKRKGGAEGGHAAVNEAASAAAMKRWLGGTGGTHSASGSPAGASSLDPGSSASVADDIFAEVPLDYCPPQPAGWASTSEALEQLRRQARDGRRRPGGTGPSNGPGGVDPNAGFSGFVEPSHPEQAFDYDLQAALSASLASLDEAHRASGPRDHAPVEPGIPAGAGGDAGTEADDAWQLEVAIALSLGMPPPPKPAAPAAQTAQYRGGHSTVSTGGSVGRKEPVVIDLLDSDGD